MAAAFGIALAISWATVAHPAHECAPLFGTAAEHSANQRHRVTLLGSVVAGEFVIDLVYTGAWKAPQPIHFRNITVTAIQNGSATVNVSAELAESSRCAPGEYIVRLDDKIGRKNSVLAILDGVLLLEREGALVYVTPPDAPEPVFRLTWQNSWGSRHSGR